MDDDDVQLNLALPPPITVPYVPIPQKSRPAQSKLRNVKPKEKREPSTTPAPAAENNDSGIDRAKLNRIVKKPTLSEIRDGTWSKAMRQHMREKMQRIQARSKQAKQSASSAESSSDSEDENTTPAESQPPQRQQRPPLQKSANASENKKRQFGKRRNSQRENAKATENQENNTESNSAAQTESSEATAEEKKPETSMPSIASYTRHTEVLVEKSWEDLNLNPYLIANLREKLNKEKPTRVQIAAIPYVMEKRDVLIKAPTGSGKTLAYALPVVNELAAVPGIHRSQGTYAIVIAPTRELSVQIYDVLKDVLRPHRRVVPGVIMGGEKRTSEKARLRKGVTILVCTPGRLIDHLEHTASFNVSNLRWLIFDEADRLLDLGFEKDIVRLLQMLKERVNPDVTRHTILVSATLNKKLEKLAALSLQDPIFVNLDTKTKGRGPTAFISNSSEEEGDDSIEIVPVQEDGEEEAEEEEPMDVDDPEEAEKRFLERELDEEVRRAHEIPPNLVQHYTIVSDKRKLVCLLAFLRSKILSKPQMKIIVFVATCDSVEFFYTLFSLIELPTMLEEERRKLNKKKKKRKEEEEPEEPETERFLPCSLFKLHGNLSQDVRISTYYAFGKAESAILFATDVAARGIDVPAVDWIVQYDVPSDPAAYIHRIGRTARLDRRGDALLMLIPSEQPYIDILTKQKMMSFERMDENQILGTLKTNLKYNPNNDPLFESGLLQHHIEDIVERTTHTDLKHMGICAFQSFVRAYATHVKSTKKIFHVKRLHLGHLARNFALKDPPSQFVKIAEKSRKRKSRSGDSDDSDMPAAKRRKFDNSAKQPQRKTYSSVSGQTSKKAAKAKKKKEKPRLQQNYNPVDEFAA